MVMRNSDVVVEINSNEQAKCLRKILNPTRQDIDSPDFTKKVSSLAKNLSSARKGMNNLRNFLQ
ncbi:hypothetical protein PO181_05685 [Leuconostoc suionicum]|uniref:hypothetical protein n=1 Tax=Leuconostoc suionicum TaxID=1511761 RepID=UPI00233E9FD1|nr:hypothetical protein [Leuconostoc suionicum]MDC2816472.1 hypothetical protein [Leuconostoc suionicum]